jgi:short-subunit dehydrogenase
MGLELNGRRALLTGASGGIGGAIARALAARGATVLLSGRRGDALTALAGQLDAAEVLPADLSETGAAADLAARAGAVDVLVANAALPGSGLVSEFTPEQIDRTLDVNLRAPMQLARALFPGMVERGAGHLVFISSLAGKAASPGAAVYSATKYGLRGFALGLRADLHGTGVGVSTIFPGFVSDAGLFADTGLELPRGVGTRSPEQVASAVVRAVERDAAEIDVAPLGLRLGAKFASVAPGINEAVQRRLGGEELSRQIGDAQSGKRG